MRDSLPAFLFAIHGHLLPKFLRSAVAACRQVKPLQVSQLDNPGYLLSLIGDISGGLFAFRTSRPDQEPPKCSLSNYFL
jgi:hypothetical protein